MGSIISLGIKKLEIDWGKNNSFNNHSILFQKEDMDVELEGYYDEDSDDGKIVIKKEKGASKPLYQIKDRLDLIGYSLKEIEKKYNEEIEEYKFILDEDVPFSYKEFFLMIKSLNVSKINMIEAFIKSERLEFDMNEYFNYVISNDKEFNKKLKRVKVKLKGWMFFGDFFENLDPYIILRMLCENEDNLNYNVEWRYEENVESGWIKRKKIEPYIEEENKILFVTEGSSDSLIIKETIYKLYPHIADLFNFIDMERNYPFTGVGNLSNFSLGLSKINMINKAIILFDNDAAGVEMYNKVIDNIKLKNTVICCLPTCKEFENFDCIGPFGENKSNINGKAVAIECFLDFSKTEIKPRIRWNNYNKNLNIYQGELENKDRYVKDFFKNDILDGSYDCSKLEVLIRYLINEWINRKMN